MGDGFDPLVGTHLTEGPAVLVGITFEDFQARHGHLLTTFNRAEIGQLDTPAANLDLAPRGIASDGFRSCPTAAGATTIPWPRQAVSDAIYLRG